ncbi:MAG TPA: hypothetical protein VHA75_02375 [Rugosimonospora sp.]|nr:hypothetical protein [Rugosimonospora sp.]
MTSPDATSPDTADVWVDGHAARTQDLSALALVNFEHFTSMQVRGGLVRGLAGHLARVDAARVVRPSSQRRQRCG